MRINNNQKFVLGLISAAMLAAPSAAQAQSKLIIEDFVGTINWSQSSGDITIDVTRGADEVNLERSIGSDVQILGEFNKIKRVRCKGSDRHKRIKLKGIHTYKSLDKYPELNIAVPANTEVVMHNSVPFVYGQPNVDIFDADIHGCAHIEVGDVTSHLYADISGAAKLTAGNIGKAEFDLSGASELKAGNVSGPLKLHMSGASQSQIGHASSGLTYRSNGASDGSIDSASGPISIKASGASDVDIYGGKASPMTVIASGASGVTFKGAVTDLEVKASGASDIAIDEISGTLKQTRSGASDINIKRYKDVVGL